MPIRANAAQTIRARRKNADARQVPRVGVGGMGGVPGLQKRHAKGVGISRPRLWRPPAM